jgi:hypothetical protein
MGIPNADGKFKVLLCFADFENTLQTTVCINTL